MQSVGVAFNSAAYNRKHQGGNTMTKTLPKAQTDSADKDLDLAIAAVDARLSGFVRDGMCFNKV
jgi:hypothetical protein